MWRSVLINRLLGVAHRREHIADSCDRYLIPSNRSSRVPNSLLQIVKCDQHLIRIEAIGVNVPKDMTVTLDDNESGIDRSFDWLRLNQGLSQHRQRHASAIGSVPIDDPRRVRGPFSDDLALHHGASHWLQAIDFLE